MHPLIQALRSELVAILARIDSGDCDISDIDNMDEVVSVIRKVSHRDNPYLSMRLANIFISVVQHSIIMFSKV